MLKKVYLKQKLTDFKQFKKITHTSGTLPHFGLYLKKVYSKKQIN